MINHHFYERFKFILSDPFNQKIERIENAGKIIDNYLIMHNGIKVIPGSYCGSFSDILLINKGVHEPQEEFVFLDIIKKVKKNSTMIELGSYWAFYSMSFLSECIDGNSFLIEEDPKYFEVGKKHFHINHMKGDFTLGKISLNDIKLDSFVIEKNINHIEILHSDIQGYEYEMLIGAKQLFLNKKIDFVFISTHDQNIHYKCLECLKEYKYKIIGSADFDNETFCHDGIIIACSSDINYPSIDLGNKSKSKMIDEVILDNMLKSIGYN